MPVAPPSGVVGDGLHREHLPRVNFSPDACVARPVSRAEAARNPLAQAALLKEWDRLRVSKCWNEQGVREWADVAAEARAAGTTHHVGRIFEICVEKNAELPADNPARKFKGRVVFQGNQVRDENWEAAMFQELSSCPATMEASKSADCYGLLPGHAIQQADAEQAYTQSKLGGQPHLGAPAARALAARLGWHARPGLPARTCAVRHPDSGGYWERHCAAHLTSVGFVEVADWRSCFWHPKWSVFLTVYVDDFKLSGPERALPSAWAAIRAGVKTGEPEAVGLYLGCRHVVTRRPSPLSGKMVQTIEYDMEDFLVACVARYRELANVQTLRGAATPFADVPVSVGAAKSRADLGGATDAADSRGECAPSFWRPSAHRR